MSYSENRDYYSYANCPGCRYSGALCTCQWEKIGFCCFYCAACAMNLTGKVPIEFQITLSLFSFRLTGQ